MKDDQLRDQVNSIIRDEIQEGINEYLETQEESEKTGLGFVQDKDEKLKVNIPNAEVDRIIKQYKRIKKKQKSNLYQAKLLDRHGKPL
tara:strand:- start:51 stop:314 length:264 start_codon:yes stop_codon:yes gene_type:complete